MNKWQQKDFFFTDSDYEKRMKTEVAPWLEEYVTKDYFYSFDRTKIAYYYALCPKAKGTIVMLHGFCEFFGKYHELMYYFYQAGYSVFFLEQRGHGHSQHPLMNSDKVYIQSYDDYVRDLKHLLDVVISERTNHKQLYLYCHSMGGCVGTLFLERYPHYFKKVVLSSPMLALNWNKLPRIVIRLLCLWSSIVRWDKRFVPGHHGFDDMPTFSRSSVLSKPRYRYMFHLRREDKYNRTYGGTYAWARSSMRAMDQAQFFAGAIQIPVLLCTAGLDTMVKNEGQDQFARHCRHLQRLYFHNSKHEIFNATDDERIPYFHALMEFYSEV